MARTDTLANYLTDIADAIREKTGSSDPIQASSFDTAIEGIPSGGGETYTGHLDEDNLLSLGYSQSDIDDIKTNGIFWNAEEDDGYAVTQAELDGTITPTNARYLPTNISQPNTFNGYTAMLYNPSALVKSNSTGQEVFNGCYSLLYPLGYPSNPTNGKWAFQNCYKLRKIPTYIDWSSLGTMYGMFAYCYSLEDLSQYTFNAGTSIQSAFEVCYNLKKAPTLYTANCTTMSYAFSGCRALVEVPELACDKVTIFGSAVFSNCSSLTTLGGFNNLGKAYTTTSSENYYNYTISLEACVNLTHDSLMNVINKLYDIKTKGCKNQQLLLGAINLSKLTAEEIAIATNKGWNVT